MAANVFGEKFFLCVLRRSNPRNCARKVAVSCSRKFGSCARSTILVFSVRLI